MVNLEKGENIKLTKLKEGLTELQLGLGWDAPETSEQTFDLDAMAFAVDNFGKVIDEKYFIYFNNLVSPNSEIVHTGDNLTGDGDGDDEIIKVDLRKMHKNIKKIVFVVNIFKASQKNQNFGQVENAYIRIVDAKTQEELARFDLTEDYSAKTNVIFGELYLHNSEWKFKATGVGSKKELTEIIAEYGV